MPQPSASRAAKEYALSSDEQGLTSEEARRRLAQFGPNEWVEARVSAVGQFLSYFWGPIAWMIEVAIVLAALVQHWEEFFVIFVLLLANAVVGFWEEHQAGNTIEALKSRLALRARVRRDGKWTPVAARELVPGDLIRLHIGDIIPADAILLPGDPIAVDQSSLTGESLPVTRHTRDTVYSGSVVKQGEIDARVAATGNQTYFGKTARLTERAGTISHFQKAVLKMGDYLIIFALALVALILLVALYRGENMWTVLEFALVLTIAAIPVAMPTVLSVTMAVGARLLAGKNAVVRRLASIEEVAGVDVLCADKTGTLTQNRLKLGEPYVSPGLIPEEVVLAGALASRWEDQDPIDLAVLSGLKDSSVLSRYEILHYMPFDPVQKRSEAEVKAPDGTRFKVSKGAFQVILGLLGDSAGAETRASESVEAFARRGFRALGVARTNESGAWVFLGVLPLFDPPRADSKATIRTARDMGIDVKMVTGDQLAIAREVSRDLGLGKDLMDATLFSDPKRLESGRFAETIEKVAGFAQVFPEHKYEIVEVLQTQGHIVAMTGDGVNDAPALKRADAGIAVAGATDAARSAADIVLLDPGLSPIIDAVKESRRIFQRMQSYAIYRISETVRVLLFMTFSILVFNFYPVTAVMIVFLALLNDGAILSIAYDHAVCSDRPERWDMRVVLGLATVLGVMGVLASFTLFYLGKEVFHFGRDALQTLIYLKLSVAGHLTIFLTRTRGPFWAHRPAPILFIAVLSTQLIATLISVHGFFMAPIGWKWALFVWVYAIVWFLINDRMKLLALHVFSEDRSALGRIRRA